MERTGDSGLAVRRGWRGLRAHMAIEHVAGEVLLEIVLGIELKDHAHVAERHRGEVGVADLGIVNACGEGDVFGGGPDGLGDGLEMLAEQIRGQVLFVDRGVQQRKAAEGKALAAALNADRFSGSAAEIHGHDLVALPTDCTVNKWQTHARYLYTSRFRC